MEQTPTKIAHPTTKLTRYRTHAVARFWSCLSGDLFAVCVITAVNLTIAWPLLVYAYIDQMGSIAGAYIGLARYVAKHWSDPGWFPLWYNGIPLENTYPPLFHRTSALLVTVLDLDPGRAYNLTSAVFFAALPVAFFFLLRFLRISLLPALLASLLYSLLSPSAWLVPEIRQDLGSAWFNRRFHSLAHYGDSPHVASMALMLLALIACARYLQQPTAKRLLLAALAVASVPLTNWLGGFGFVVLFATFYLAYFPLLSLQVILRSLLVAVLAYFLASPWLHPLNIATVIHNAQYVVGFYPMGGWQYTGLTAIIGLLLVAKLIYHKLRFDGPLQFGLQYTVATAGIFLSGYWLPSHLVPQPKRYHLHFDVAVCLLAAFFIHKAWTRFPSVKVRLALLLPVVAVSATLLFIQQLRSQQLARPLDIKSTGEYRLASFLEGQAFQRVYVPGSTGFWLNAVSDTPQLDGGFANGITSRALPGATYQILTGENSGERETQVSLLWLQAYGVQAVSVSFPESSEFYKPYRNPLKFEGTLPVIWTYQGVKVYALPMVKPGLVHVIPDTALVQQIPEHGLDTAEVERYVSALASSEPVPAAREGCCRFLIRAQLQSGQVISIQESYDPGWQAYANGKPVKIEPDGLGLMVLRPDCMGTCDIELIYDGGLLRRICRLASVVTLLLLAVRAAIEERRSR